MLSIKPKSFDAVRFFFSILDQKWEFFGPEVFRSLTN